MAPELSFVGPNKRAQTWARATKLRFGLAMAALLWGGLFVIQGATNIFESPTPAPESALDKIVFEKLPAGRERPALCSDAVFVRRIYLDLLGTLPTGNEARQFIEDPDSKMKRSRLIEQLLARDEFADYWAMNWGDILRIKAEFPVNLWPNAAQAYHRWVRASLGENKPYDRFARELLTSSGSNFRVGPVNFYRAIQNRTPEGIARAVALAFMGARAENWPTNRLAGMLPFFSQIGYKPTGEWKEEHVFWDPLGTSASPENSAPGRASVAAIGNPTNNPATTGVVARTSKPAGGAALEGRAMDEESPSGGEKAVFPDGTAATLSRDRDPREVFADWLVRPENPWFTKCVVNRVWAWLLGRGIIEEADDIRDDNLPSNPALLAYLEKEMVAGHYDMKKLYRLILNSQAYQAATTATSGELVQTRDEKRERSRAEIRAPTYVVRRLDAEVLIDAINKVTGSSDLYTSPIPEPFTYIPKGMPAVTIADGSITSPFLALFGRSARATGMMNERNHKPTPAQALYLLNSTEIQRKLEQGTNLQRIIAFGTKRPPQILEDLYLTILSRFPTPEEIQAVEGYARGQATKPAPARPMTGTNAPNPETGGTNRAAATNLAKVESRLAEVEARATNAVAGTNASSTNAPKGRPLGSLGTRKEAKASPAGKPTPAKTRDDWIDVAWSLINSEEFLYRH